MNQDMTNLRRFISIHKNLKEMEKNSIELEEFGAPSLSSFFFDAHLELNKHLENIVNINNLTNKKVDAYKKLNSEIYTRLKYDYYELYNIGQNHEEIFYESYEIIENSIDMQLSKYNNKKIPFFECGFSFFELYIPRFSLLDFMLTDDLNFAEFRFYSPAQWESKYKGVYRTVLLLIILKVISKQILETTHEGEPLTWKRLFIDAQKGLVEITQTRKGKTSKLLKNIKTIDRRVITKDINQILEYMFGKGIKPKDVGSFEQIWHLIHQPNWQYRNKLNEIIKEYKQKLIDIGLPLPEEMKGV